MPGANAKPSHFRVAPSCITTFIAVRRTETAMKITGADVGQAFLRRAMLHDLIDRAPDWDSRQDAQPASFLPPLALHPSNVSE
jgi:hypothetical protein